MSAEVVTTSWQREPAVRLCAGQLTATFLPEVGMTGVSLELRGREYLAVPGGVAALRRHSTGGLPLLAPWANRLAARRYRAAGTDVDLHGIELGTDDNGLPIHGLLVGRPGWRIERTFTDGAHAGLVATIDVDSPAFPFAHRIDIRAVATDQELVIETTVVPTGGRAVPIAFGWHPYLRLPGGERERWRLVLPERRRLLLDEDGIPTGAEIGERAEAAPIGQRTFDDLYSLDGDHHLVVETAEGRSLRLRSGAGYPFAQVWVPPGRDFLALEPMTAPTNALVAGDAPLVAPGETFTAGFTLTPG